MERFEVWSMTRKDVKDDKVRNDSTKKIVFTTKLST